MSLAPALALREGDLKRLSELARLPTVPAGLAKRARIVLLAADGVSNAQIARTAGVSRPTVIGWRERYLAGGIAAGGRTRRARAARRDRTRSRWWSPPWRTTAARRSWAWASPQRHGRRAGRLVRVVARIWRKWNIQPHRAENVQVLHRPGAGDQDPRRRRAVSCAP